ncbi:hypothetical protein E4U32_002208 [Claviceps aff. humidiphila group G2b]|nr:hypothetical protein E4U32_002208 [Claviceps aff. humidiphila group G2b]
MYHVSSEGVRHDTRRRECSECDDSDETSATGRDEMLRVVVDLTTLEGSRVRPEVRAEAQMAELYIRA